MAATKSLIKSIVPRSVKMAVARQISPKVGFISEEEKRKVLDLDEIKRLHRVSEISFGDASSLSGDISNNSSRLIAFSKAAKAFPETERHDSDRITSLQALRVGRDVTPVGWNTPLELSPVDLECEYNFKIYYPGLNLLYNEIPKNASSAIKAILLSIEKEGRINPYYARGFTHHKRWQAAYPDLQVNWDDFEWRGAFRFAFQRNPFDRVVSAYKNAGWADHYGHMEFPAFVEQLPELLQAPLTDLRAIHLKPVSCFVPRVNGTYYVDFMGKVENFDEDIRTILAAAGITKISKLPVVNASQHKPYREYYDAQTRKIIERLYEEDLAYGEYSF